MNKNLSAEDIRRGVRGVWSIEYGGESPYYTDNPREICWLANMYYYKDVKITKYESDNRDVIRTKEGIYAVKNAQNP